MPEDTDAVQSAIRLGWTVAEVRGRNRPGGPAGGWSRLPEQADSDHTLPLGSERSLGDVGKQTQVVLAALALKLGVETEADKWTEAVDNLIERLQANRGNGDAAQASWQKLSELIYRFDACIQDTLTANSFAQGSGYLLGRGLAECYWALNPDELSGPAGWGFLLGNDRCNELKHLAIRLSPYMAPSAASVLSGSLSIWRQVAVTPSWRNARADLYPQIRIWHDIVVLGHDPALWVRPGARLSVRYVLSRNIRYYSGRLVLGLVGIAGLIALIITLGTGSGGSLANTLLAIVAAAGLFGGGSSARRVAQEVNNDLVAIAITRAPPPPRRSDLIGAVRRR